MMIEKLVAHWRSRFADGSVGEEQRAWINPNITLTLAENELLAIVSILAEQKQKEWTSSIAPVEYRKLIDKIKSQYYEQLDNM